MAIEITYNNCFVDYLGRRVHRCVSSNKTFCFDKSLLFCKNWFEFPRKKLNYINIPNRLYTVM